jgi:hypothetical protein
MRSTVCAITFIALAGVAHAEGGSANEESESEDVADPVVVISATSKLGNLGGLERVNRVLDSRGMRAQLPDKLAATLDGRNVLIADIDAIREAFADLDYKTALATIQANEERILQNVGAGDPIPALSQLCEWRGVIAAAREEDEEAIQYFRAALRLNPAWVVDKRLSTGNVRKLVKKAKREVAETGRLLIETDPEEAMATIDDGKPQPVNQKMTLPVGLHLVVVSAAGHARYAEMVEIDEGKLEKLPIKLDEESRADKAAKLVDKVMTAAPGKPRLNKLRGLEKYTKKYTSATRYLVVEDSNAAQQIRFRLYDVDNIKVSKPIELDLSSETNAEITAKIISALDPENMVDPGTVMVIERDRSQRWYERWYVWVGIAAVAGGGALTYHYMTREPTSIRGF